MLVLGSVLHSEAPLLVELLRGGASSVTVTVLCQRIWCLVLQRAAMSRATAQALGRAVQLVATSSSRCEEALALPLGSVQWVRYARPMYLTP